MAQGGLPPRAKDGTRRGAGAAGNHSKPSSSPETSNPLHRSHTLAMSPCITSAGLPSQPLAHSRPFINTWWTDRWMDGRLDG